MWSRRTHRKTVNCSLLEVASRIARPDKANSKRLKIPLIKKARCNGEVTKVEFLAPLYLPLPLPSSSHALLGLRFTTSSMDRFPVVGWRRGGGRQQESLQRKIKILLVCNGCVVFAYSVYNGETRIVTIHELFRIYRYYYL